jgi:hypothetical protein
MQLRLPPEQAANLNPPPSLSCTACKRRPRATIRKTTQPRRPTPELQALARTPAAMHTPLLQCPESTHHHHHNNKSQRSAKRLPALAGPLPQRRPGRLPLATQPSRASTLPSSASSVRTSGSSTWPAASAESTVIDMSNMIMVCSR